MNWLYLAIAILSEVIGTTALKSSNGFTKVVPSILVAIGYGCSFYFLSLTLRSIPVGIAYAVWSGVGVVLISILGWWLFGQKLDLNQAFADSNFGLISGRSMGARASVLARP